MCVVSFGICFLFCLTFFTFSTRLLIEAFHSFLLRLRVYPYTYTQTYVYVLLCVSMFCCTYVHMYVSVCVCVVRTYIWRLLGAPLPGKCSLILQLVLVKRVQRFSLSLCMCVCLRNFCLHIVLIVICLALFIYLHRLRNGFPSNWKHFNFNFFVLFCFCLFRFFPIVFISQNLFSNWTETTTSVLLSFCLFM